MAISIKSGIPVPKLFSMGRPAMLYPFAELMVSDSFFVTLAEGETEKQVLNRVRASAQRWKKTAAEGMKLRVTTQPDPDTGAPAVGVWRLA